MHKLFYLCGEFGILQGKSAKRVVRMKQSTILSVILPNVHQFLKFFHQQTEW